MVRDFNYYRSLANEQEKKGEFVEIGPAGTLKRLWRWFAWSAGLIGVAALFVLLFYRFTNSFRIALVVVVGMLAYMFVASKLAEGRFDKRNGD